MGNIRHRRVQFRRGDLFTYNFISNRRNLFILNMKTLMFHPDLLQGEPDGPGRLFIICIHIFQRHLLPGPCVPDALTGLGHSGGRVHSKRERKDA